MSTGESRTLDELLDRYSQHPDFSDIYVEGVVDRGLLGWFFVDAGLPEVTAYDIGTVNLPSEIVRSYGLEVNNRGRVVALARFLYEKLGHQVGVSAVIDADLDYALKKRESCPLIYRTDYTSMEMYFFNEKAVHKFIHTCCATLPATAKDMLLVLAPPLKKVFAGRLANYHLGWNLKRVAIDPSCEISRDPLRISLDWDHYVDRYLNKNGRMKDKEAFQRAVEEYEKSMARLPLLRRIHGHDYIDLLAFCCSRLKPKAGLSRADLLGSMLRGGATTELLLSEPLFRSLADRYSIK